MFLSRRVTSTKVFFRKLTLTKIRGMLVRIEVRK